MSINTPQFTQPFVTFPLCSLKTAGILILTGNLVLCLALFLTVSTSMAYVYLNVGAVLQTYLLHSLTFMASILSALPILCVQQQKIIARQLNSVPEVNGLHIVILPTLLSMLWAGIQSWVNGFTIYLAGLTMLQSAVFMGLFSYVWLLAYRPPSLIVAELEEADLQHLGAVIRPHFFFNALNAVMGLIRVEPKRAEAVLQDTAELFRSVMHQHQQRLVTLAMELETCKQYTRIEQARLEKRLLLNWQIDNTLLAVSLPPFSLQPLIENAIRHGVEPILEGGTVNITVYRRAEYLVLHVINPINSADSTHFKQVQQHNGIALNNIKERLRLMYDDAATFKYGVVKDKYEAEIVLPLEVEAT